MRREFIIGCITTLIVCTVFYNISFDNSAASQWRRSRRLVTVIVADAQDEEVNVSVSSNQIKCLGQIEDLEIDDPSLPHDGNDDYDAVRLLCAQKDGTFIPIKGVSPEWIDGILEDDLFHPGRDTLVLPLGTSFEKKGTELVLPLGDSNIIIYPGDGSAASRMRMEPTESPTMALTAPLTVANETLDEVLIWNNTLFPTTSPTSETSLSPSSEHSIVPTLRKTPSPTIHATPFPTNYPTFHPTKSPPQPTRKTLGTRTVLAVRVIAADAQTTSSLAQISDNLFGSNLTEFDAHNLRSRYLACSFGQLSFVPAPGFSHGVTQVTLPHVVVSRSERKDVANEVTVALNRKFGVGSPEELADHVVYCLPPGSSGGGWVAYATVDGWNSVYNDEWCNSVSAQTHEIGHNLGLCHSGQDGEPYADQSGLMGFSYRGDDTGPMCFNAAKSYQTQWYHSSTLQLSLPLEPQHYTTHTVVGIADYLNNPASHPVILRLSDPSFNMDRMGDEYSRSALRGDSFHAYNYYIGFNRKSGVNMDTKEAQDMVTVVKMGVAPSEMYGDDDSIRCTQSWLMANLKFGETYTSPHDELSIKVDSIDLSSRPATATVSICRGSCPHSSSHKSEVVPHGDQALCHSSAECDDGNFCNGAEICVPSYGCLPAQRSPCDCYREMCIEFFRMCLRNPFGSFSRCDAETKEAGTDDVTDHRQPQGDVILEDGFEVGWGHFHSGGKEAQLYNGTHLEWRRGDGSLVIQSGEGDFSSAISSIMDVTLYHIIRVQFSYLAHGMDKNEDFFLEFQGDDEKEWQVVSFWVMGVDFVKDEWYDDTQTIDVTGYERVRIRFRCDASSSMDKVFIDDVKVEGHMVVL